MRFSGPCAGTPSAFPFIPVGEKRNENEKWSRRRKDASNAAMRDVDQANWPRFIGAQRVAQFIAVAKCIYCTMQFAIRTSLRVYSKSSKEFHFWHRKNLKAILCEPPQRMRVEASSCVPPDG